MLQSIHSRFRLSNVLAILFLVGISHPLAAQPPNILFLFADDWGRYASAYAKYEPQNALQALVRTPNIDRIAERGVLFRNAFVSAPSCTPCRSALLSGQHFWRTGQASILQGAKWDSTIPAFPLLLHDAGYHIGESFKVGGLEHPTTLLMVLVNSDTRKLADVAMTSPKMSRR
jgi:N-sulfoglucosamine sulfohydrolase